MKDCYNLDIMSITVIHFSSGELITPNLDGRHDETVTKTIVTAVANACREGHLERTKLYLTLNRLLFQWLLG